MAPPIALVVGNIYFEDAKWQALFPAVTLKVSNPPYVFLTL
jgi:hypothetical protein